MKLRIGTRKSRLALAQSNWVKDQIENRHPHVIVELVGIKTRGDKILDSPLSKVGGKGLFVKEIEEALMREDVDLAVHSIKDVPAELPEGLHLPIFPAREDPRDAFVSPRYGAIDDLPQGSSVGTGSLRRSAQLLAIRPDLDIVPIRGNVDTRIKKLDQGEIEAIILAAAGLNRLGLGKRIGSFLSSDQILPAIGQGALGLEIRENDEKTFEGLSFLNHKETELTVRAERAFLKRLEGGCQVPIAAQCMLEDDHLRMKGLVAELDGSRIISHTLKKEKERPEELGYSLAENLLSSGADKILANIYGKTS